jgi:hypothetical protein
MVDETGLCGVNIVGTAMEPVRAGKSRSEGTRQAKILRLGSDTCWNVKEEGAGKKAAPKLPGLGTGVGLIGPQQRGKALTRAIPRLACESAPIGRREFRKERDAEEAPTPVKSSHIGSGDSRKLGNAFHDGIIISAQAGPLHKFRLGNINRPLAKGQKGLEACIPGVGNIRDVGIDVFP